MKVKNSAIIYTGYTYQTLQGVKILADWLSSPATYSRVAFEADEDNAEIPTGIDDIVCERPDGVVDFWQVKFTPSPEKAENSFNWEWLLAVGRKHEGATGTEFGMGCQNLAMHTAHHQPLLAPVKLKGFA